MFARLLTLVGIAALAVGCSKGDPQKHREAAEAVLALRGKVKLVDGAGDIDKKQMLPEGKFHLARIDLNGTQASDKDVDKIAVVERLDYLGLHGTRITDQALQHVARIARLKELELSNTRITDKGLEHLTGLSKLEKLYVSQTAVTDAGIERLQSALSGCKIIRIK